MGLKGHPNFCIGMGYVAPPLNMILDEEPIIDVHVNLAIHSLNTLWYIKFFINNQLTSSLHTNMVIKFNFFPFINFGCDDF